MLPAPVAPGPPPAAREPSHLGVASARLRRTSAKSAGGLPQSTDAVEGEVSLVAQQPLHLASNQEPGNGGARGTRGSRLGSHREERFSFQRPRREQTEAVTTIAALQENVAALTAFNQREKALSASLQAEVAQLTKALKELNGRNREIDRRESWRTGSSLNIARPAHSDDVGLLPDINKTVTLEASTAALQQHTQMEVSYQRKVLSLENRCTHLMENNKKLLTKIQQLEKNQTEADVQARTLRQDSSRLATEVETLNSTITSQSALVIGLRTTVHKLSVRQVKLALSLHEQALTDLKRSLERCQSELGTVKQREKLLREEHDKLKTAASHEKEAMMSKILGFQQRLQQSDVAGGDVETLDLLTKKLQKENAALLVDLETSQSHRSQLETRVRQLDQLSEEFLQVKRVMETEENELQAELTAKQQALDTSLQHQKDTELRAQQAEEQRGSATANEEELRRLLETREGEIETLMQKLVQLEGELEQQTQRNTGLLDELHQVKGELQGMKLLSQDETVQALQKARQKAATHEALTLLNEEKSALEDQLRIVQERLDAGQEALLDEKEAKKQLTAALEANALTVEQLRKENSELRARAAQRELEGEQADTVRGLESLRSEHRELRQSHDTINTVYKALVSREKYKTEAFQNQVRLLQNENGELSAKLEGFCKDLVKERQVVDAQTLEMAELNSRVLSPDVIRLLRKTQESLEQTMTALMEAEHASESSFTCLQCVQLFVDPMTLAPCGHTYCAACLAKCGAVDVPHTISCKMCEAENVRETECVFPNHALADLTARFVFRQQSLASLTSMCLSLRNGFANRTSTPQLRPTQ
ncbi:hypothetical protein BBJ28_00008494 [Nothophytophthora sp. Chile5]|nr:hypothetical protein BBJ28_00008494 [Nothophytophthora sp. Chile5]